VIHRRGALSRCFRVKPPDTSFLLADAKKFLETRWWEDLSRAHQQGLTISGNATVEQFDRKPLIAILLTSDAGVLIKKRYQERNIAPETFIIEKTSRQLAAQFNSGPRSVVGLMSGRTTQSLLTTLREGASVG